MKMAPNGFKNPHRPPKAPRRGSAGTPRHERRPSRGAALAAFFITLGAGFIVWLINCLGGGDVFGFFDDMTGLVIISTAVGVCMYMWNLNRSRSTHPGKFKHPNSEPEGRAPSFGKFLGAILLSIMACLGAWVFATFGLALFAAEFKMSEPIVGILSNGAIAFGPVIGVFVLWQLVKPKR